MTTNELIQAICDLSWGRVPVVDISDFLYRNNCLYMLSKLPVEQHPRQFIAERALNNIATKERYRSVQQMFDRLHIPYAVIKGAVLSYSAYDDPLARFSGDIDVLIRRQDIDIIKELLLSLGFVQGRVSANRIIPYTREEILFHNISTHQCAPFVKETKNPLCPYINLDVNTDIFWGESQQKADMDTVLSYRETLSLWGISFFKLSKEMEFISLCLHHYKDMNSLYLLTSGRFNLGLFCDIYYYLRNAKPDAIILSKLCSQLNAGKYIYTCIYHTVELFRDPTLKEYLDFLLPQKDDSLLASFGLTDRERKPWDITLTERLLHPDLPQYVLNKLSQEEKNKIMINRKYM